MQTRTDAYTHAHIRTYIRTHAHTHIHTHTDTHALAHRHTRTCLQGCDRGTYESKKKHRHTYRGTHEMGEPHIHTHAHAPYMGNTRNEEQKTRFLFRFGLFCEYSNLEYVRIHAIYRVHQAGCAIHIPADAPPEYVNMYSPIRTLAQAHAFT